MRVKAKKRFGQNFLVDHSIIDEIIDTAKITKQDTIIEIGPGTGNLTRKLLEYAGQVIAVEIDRDLTPVLENEFGRDENFCLINSDIMKTSLEEIISNAKFTSRKIVANLPYYITTPILMKILESDADIKSSTVMVQKEVALRMVAKAGTSDYGALSLAVQYYSNPQIAVDVPRNCFRPIPNVDSAVVSLTSKKTKLDKACQTKMFSIVKAAFAQRRKTLVNALFAGGFGTKDEIKCILTSFGWDENIRGERLSLEDYILLSERL